ncbi:MAG: ATP-binding protein [Candidatus Binatia bacterium]
MRLAVKSTATLIVLYLLVLVGLALWLDYQLRSTANSLMEGTARLVGTEVAAAMSESALEQLLQGDPETHERLAQAIAELTQRSHVVASLAVVDASGRVVVSDELEAGRQLASPAVVFQDTRAPQFLSPRSPFVGGAYHLFVPLVRHDQLVGYVRLSLGSEHIAALYRRGRRQIVVAAALGLTAIGALGFLLHVQITRRSAALARTLEATARGEIVPVPERRDEFAEVLEAAGRLGRELSETRERSSQAQRRMGALANFLDVGVLLLGPGGTVDFANATARELLACQAMPALSARWRGVKDTIEAALGRPLEAGAAGARADVDVPLAGDTRRLRVELHCPGDDERAGYLVMLKDRDFLDAFETDLRLATQMRSLARIYGALAHELRAPLGAMAINLELLHAAVRSDGAPDLQARQQRYTDVLREELARLNRSLLVVLNQTTSLNADRGRFDLEEILRDLESLLAAQAQQQHVTLEVQPPGPPVRVVGQRDRLKQALLNIATNALDAMPDGGRLALALAANDRHVTLAIRDTGPGMSAEVMGKIYDMHFTTKTGGTGIGLYVARSIIESHGGDIQVTSTLGEGTCFRVQLPREPSPA